MEDHKQNLVDEFLNIGKNVEEQEGSSDGEYGDRNQKEVEYERMR